MGYLKIPNLYKQKDILMFKQAYALEKVHGTSAYIGHDVEKDKLIIYAGGCKYKQFTDIFDLDKILDNFRANAKEHGYKKAIVFGEAFGGKMQGMSKTYGEQLKFIAFEVKIDKFWLSVPQAEMAATGLGFDFVPYRLINTTEEEINNEMMRDSEVAIRYGMGEGKLREGIVLRPPKELTFNNGERIIAKHKRPEFAERRNTPKFTDPAELKKLDDANAIADEWVTPGRLMNAKSKFKEEDWVMENMGNIIKYVYEDILVEAGDEIGDDKFLRKAVGKRVVNIFKKTMEDNLWEK